MKMTPVISSNIKEIGHDPAGKVLHITFKNGKTYEYADVPAFKHEELLAAESQTKHFNMYIRPAHKCTPLA